MQIEAFIREHNRTKFIRQSEQRGPAQEQRRSSGSGTGYGTEGPIVMFQTKPQDKLPYLLRTTSIRLGQDLTRAPNPPKTGHLASSCMLYACLRADADARARQRLQSPAHATWMLHPHVSAALPGSHSNAVTSSRMPKNVHSKHFRR